MKYLAAAGCFALAGLVGTNAVRPTDYGLVMFAGLFAMLGLIALLLPDDRKDG